MIALLFFALMIVILLLNRRLFGKLCISDLFTVMWFGCAGLSSTGFLGLYPPGWRVYLMALFCGIFFNVVYITFRKLSGVEYRTLVRSDFTDDVHYRLLVIVNVLAWLFCLYFLPNAIRILAERGFAALRETAYTESAWASTQQLLLFQWVILPIFTATEVVTAISFVLRLRHTKLLLIFSVIGIALYMLLFGGRGIIIKFVMFMAMAVLFRESGNIVAAIRKYRKIVILGVLLVILLLWLTSLRSLAGHSAFANLYVYFVGPFCYLPKLLEVHPVGEVMMWGGAMLNFVVCFFWMAARIFFRIDYGAADHIITSMDAVYYQIGENATINAMPTMMYPFLVDFGYPGLAVGVCLFALLSAVVERGYYRKHTIRSFGLLVYFGHIIVFSVQNYALFKPESAMIMIFIALFTTGVRYRGGILQLR